jgi:signal transduction histidine kinase/CheY-like chemotaxis protein
MTNLSALKQELPKTISQIRSLDDNFQINKIIEDVIVKITDTEFASIWIYDFPFLVRQRDQETHKISVEKKEGLLYECFAKKESVIYNYISSEKGYVASIDNPDKIKIKSKIMIPLIDDDTFIGIATAYSSVKKIKKFSNNDLKIFQAITPFIIEAVYKMKQNMHSGTPKSTNIMQDTTSNLEQLEKSQADSNSSSDEMLDFVSNIVHDIRTPANSLAGFLDILQEKIEDRRLQEYISHAKNSALLINELTTSILDGISDKRQPTSSEPEEINTGSFFATIAEIFSANMSKKNINYNIFIDPLLPKEIKLNKMKTKRVIMNLISNASKFTPQDGSIEFSVRYKHKEKKLHIYVKDNGIGIAKEKQEEIFKAFTQAEENTKDIYGGTGLGLSICAAYVKDMGGKLSIESKPNQGSTFYFDLPMDIKDYAQQFAPIKNPQASIAILMDKHNTVVANHIGRYLVKIGINVDKIMATPNLNSIPKDTTHLISFQEKLSGDVFTTVKKKKLHHLVVEENFLSLEQENLDGALLISQYSYSGDTLYSFVNEKSIPKVLIVEDDNVSIMLVKYMLENEYCEIDVATNGQEGLELLSNALKENNPYHIVYTDHSMPKLSGSDMLKEYKKLEKHSSLRKTFTVSISGDARNMADYSYTHFATKPFKKSEIVSLFLKTLN